MSSDSVSPSSLSLRTSRLNDAVSRPSSAARSGARTSGERSTIASVRRVHGPVDDAASRRSRRARISASSASVGGRCRNAIRGSSPAQRRPTRNTGRSARAASPRRNASRDAPARRASSSVIVASSTGSTEVTSISPTEVRIRVPTTTRGRSQRRKPRSIGPALIPASSTGRIITPLRLAPVRSSTWIYQRMLTIVADRISAELLQAGTDMRVALGRVVRRLRQGHVVGEATLSEVSVLSRLDRDGPTTPGCLAELERVRPQAMGVTLAGLDGARAGGAQPRCRGRAPGADVGHPAGRRLLTDRRSRSYPAVAQALADGFTADERRRLSTRSRCSSGWRTGCDHGRRPRPAGPLQVGRALQHHAGRAESRPSTARS